MIPPRFILNLPISVTHSIHKTYVFIQHLPAHDNDFMRDEEEEEKKGKQSEQAAIHWILYA